MSPIGVAVVSIAAVAVVLGLQYYVQVVCGQWMPEEKKPARWIFGSEAVAGLLIGILLAALWDILR